MIKNQKKITFINDCNTVFALKSQGLSFNKISKILNLDWGCVKQRYEDYVHDNPELLEGSL